MSKRTMYLIGGGLALVAVWLYFRNRNKDVVTSKDVGDFVDSLPVTGTKSTTSFSKQAPKKDWGVIDPSFVDSLPDAGNGWKGVPYA